MLASSLMMPGSIVGTHFTSGRGLRSNETLGSRLWDPDDLAAHLSAAGFVHLKMTKAFSDEAADGFERMVSFVARTGGLGRVDLAAHHAAASR